jgi:hypothetical protein
VKFHIHRIFGFHGIRNYSAHVKKGHNYNVDDAANWMYEMNAAAGDLNLPEAQYQIGLLFHQFIEEY